MLGVLAYPRTGSTLVYEVLKQHYDGNSSITGLGEVFNPLEFQKIIVEEDRLSMTTFDSPLPAQHIQHREERYELFKDRVEDGYLIKIFPQDLRYDPIFDLIKTYYKRLVVVKRKDIIDTILSALIAMEHRRFNAIDNKFKYNTFEAKLFEVEWLCHLFNQYGSFTSRLISNTTVGIYYEDVIKMKRAEIVEICGLTPNHNDNGPLPLSKLLKKEEKIPLIRNIGDVLRVISSTIILDNLDISGYHLV